MNFYQGNMLIDRIIHQKISQYLSRREIISIIGPHQAGKTTLLTQLRLELEQQGKKVIFLTFESQNERTLFETSPEDFISLYRGNDVIIIDEFQYAKAGGQTLKYLYDTTPFKFIISGSSSLELTFQTGTYLVGRILQFELWPFCFTEYLRAVDLPLAVVLQEYWYDVIASNASKKWQPASPALASRLARYWAEYLVWGGYPAVVLSPTAEQKTTTLQNLFDTYVLKDVRGLLQLATDRELVMLAQVLAAQLGSVISYHELSATVGLPFTQLKKHLHLLQGTFIIDLLTPFFRNKRSELTKSPKVYFYDNGLRNLAVRNLNLNLASRSDSGGLAENAVYMNLRSSSKTALHFWRSKGAAEVDFVIEQTGEILPLEIKFSTHPSVGKSLTSFITKYKPRRAIVATKDVVATERVGDCEIQFVPMWYLV